jgi:hypothetical protein
LLIEGAFRHHQGGRDPDYMGGDYYSCLPLMNLDGITECSLITLIILSAIDCTKFSDEQLLNLALHWSSVISLHIYAFGTSVFVDDSCTLRSVSYSELSDIRFAETLFSGAIVAV